MQRLTDRRAAGRLLAEKLTAYADREDTVVLGLPRGGVVVAFEVAKALNAPLDVLLVRKLGAPGQEELAFGAIASGGVRVMNEDVVRAFDLSQAQIEAVIAREQAELERRARAYRGESPPPELEGKTVIVVDDGLATGASMRTALRSLRAHGLKRLILAVPVAPASTCAAMAKEADEAICLMTPEPFYAIGQWYEDFFQTSDQEVVELLREAASFGRTGAEGTQQ
ncbi:MAG TPA: phosphoribosyltransferase [Thermoleophilia bacterium]|nr:phosphoribosyltransferase [Thermoleophilia bacterium]